MVKPYPTDDLGRYFVSKTEPYLHDGSVRHLEDMIAIMGEYQLGKKLSNDEIRDIIQFLKSLDGDLNRIN